MLSAKFYVVQVKIVILRVSLIPLCRVDVET